MKDVIEFFIKNKYGYVSLDMIRNNSPKLILDSFNYSVDENIIKKRLEEYKKFFSDRIVLLKNNFSFSFPFKNNSKYDGLFFYKKHKKLVKAIKILDSIELEGNRILEQVYYNPYDESFKLIYDDGLIVKYSIKILKKTNEKILVFESNRNVDGSILLDVRYAYDTVPFHKKYSIKKKNIPNYNKLKKLYKKFFDDKNVSEEYFEINFKKVNDQEKYKHYNLDFSFEILFQSSNLEVVKTNEWVRKIYPFEQSRNDYPYEFYSYKAFEFKNVKRIIFGLKKIHYYNEELFSDFEKSFVETFSFDENNENDKNKNNKNNTFNAFLFSSNLIDINIKKLFLEGKGNKDFFAGLPWFFQHWIRDSSISSVALNGFERKELLLNILEDVFKKNFDEKANFESSLRSADGLLIVFKRLKDLIVDSAFDNKLFSKVEKNIIQKRALKYYEYLKQYFYDKNFHLIFNNSFETWMDTIERRGFNIEINALFLSLLELIYILEENNVKKEDYYIILKFHKQKVKEHFYNDGFLYDNISFENYKSNYFTNNVFLAYYYFKHFLSDEEWELVFDNALKELFHDGLISSLSYKSNEYCKFHSGINNKSYHRGDSWFFVNNIAALVLKDLNFEKYKLFILQILNSSLRDFFCYGAFCYSSEISSSEILESKGCWIQTWSLATLKELVDSFK